MYEIITIVSFAILGALIVINTLMITRFKCKRLEKARAVEEIKTENEKEINDFFYFLLDGSKKNTKNNIKKKAEISVKPNKGDNE